MNHMLATAALGDLGTSAAALLPCPWTYHTIGERLAELGTPDAAYRREEWPAHAARRSVNLTCRQRRAGN
jgi:thiaminase (transcriptional activator TenA)